MLPLPPPSPAAHASHRRSDMSVRSRVVELERRLRDAAAIDDIVDCVPTAAGTTQLGQSVHIRHYMSMFERLAGRGQSPVRVYFNQLKCRAAQQSLKRTASADDDEFGVDDLDRVPVHKQGGTHRSALPMPQRSSASLSGLSDVPAVDLKPVWGVQNISIEARHPVAGAHGHHWLGAQGGLVAPHATFTRCRAGRVALEHAPHIHARFAVAGHDLTACHPTAQPRAENAAEHSVGAVQPAGPQQHRCTQPRRPHRDAKQRPQAIHAFHRARHAEHCAVHHRRFDPLPSLAGTRVGRQSRGGRCRVAERQHRQEAPVRREDVQGEPAIARCGIACRGSFSRCAGINPDDTSFA